MFIQTYSWIGCLKFCHYCLRDVCINKWRTLDYLLLIFKKKNLLKCGDSCKKPSSATRRWSNSAWQQRHNFVWTRAVWSGLNKHDCSHSGVCKSASSSWWSMYSKPSFRCWWPTLIPNVFLFFLAAFYYWGILTERLPKSIFKPIYIFLLSHL